MPVADIMRAYQLGSAAACVPSSARTARQEDHPHPVGYQSHRRTQVNYGGKSTLQRLRQLITTPLFNQNSLTMDSRAQLSLMGKGSTTIVGGHATIGSFSADVLAFFLRRIMFCSPCSTILPCFCATSFSMALDSAFRPSSHPKGRAPSRHISKGL
ncbi:uncharacterized protein AKAW2_20179A [Aspergillus luchuensis]|uniref:Uncharacterized protein n=1 Tax=Aspergillus kawachii TaxID=1069201 RepID=A0A7R7ZVY4_ASPKA|nr:uncharacterized protein AKAW2_20179A [Aspergillus luchuensis]BCR95239.1 hypothetical protein AKAW2_20179A [Aspergillus luchuensis]